MKQLIFALTILFSLSSHASAPRLDCQWSSQYSFGNLPGISRYLSLNGYSETSSSFLYDGMHLGIGGVGVAYANAKTQPSGEVQVVLILTAVQPVYTDGALGLKTTQKSKRELVPLNGSISVIVNGQPDGEPLQVDTLTCTRTF